MISVCIGWRKKWFNITKMHGATMKRVKVTVYVDKKIYVNILTDKFEMYFYVDWLLSCQTFNMFRAAGGVPN